MNDRPNILLVMADQLAPQTLPSYGHPVVQTPHLDRLAGEGVVFENAYCNFPLCSPSRASMLSGRLPSRIGIYDNAVEFPASVPTFNHHLRLAGYRTCLAGKGHFVGPDQLHGYEDRVTTDVYPADFLWSPDWNLDGDTWLEWYHSMRAALDAGEFPRSVNIAYDDEVEFEALRWLQEHASADDSRPFALTVSFSSPHDPYLAPSRWWNLYRDEDIDLPSAPDIPLDDRDPHSRRHWFLTGRHRDMLNESDLVRMRRAYYATVSYVDAKLGRLMESLEEMGAADNTMVVFTSDHGDMLGERGMFFKMSFYEWSARVPMIARAPFARRGARVADCVSLLDLMPTLLDAAGAAAPKEAEGRSLAPLMRGEGDVDRERPVYCEYLAEGSLAPMMMVRQGAWKLMASPCDPPLLYNLESDPQEMANRAEDPACAEKRQQLERLLAECWDVEGLDRQVRQSQASRHVLREALATGRRTSWDYQPRRDASQMYVRELGDIQDVYTPR